MKLQQLRYCLEVYKQKLNVSEAAEVLFTSQPGISKQIRLLEEEIGVPIFVRQGKRLVGVTQAGEMVLAIADRILRDAQNIKKIGDDFSRTDTGTLTIASILAWSKNAFSPIFVDFCQEFPNCSVSLKTCTSQTVIDLLEKDEADIGISCGNPENWENVHYFPFTHLKPHLIVRKNHPLAHKETIHWSDFLQYPLLLESVLTDDDKFFLQNFVEYGLEKPEILLTSSDLNTIFSLVAQKMGIGVVVSDVSDGHPEIISKDLSHLIKPIPLYLVLKSNHYLKSYAYRFMEKIAPQFNAGNLKKLLYQPIVEDYSI